jgi:hypothetical protein
MGAPGPPSLQKFLRENAFWDKLGIPAEPLGPRPWKEVRDYEVIVAALNREEAANMKQ